MRDSFAHPLIRRIGPSKTPPGDGILYVGLFVPDELASIEIIAQDACTPCSVPPNGRILSGATLGARYAFGVQRFGNGTG